ncbi:NAD-dependent epimerase/dehydratase family protein [Sphingomonas sp. SUN019]|uniref:NAD-dependent epimerase/dehydratase family protein n=1 Tax=Sphingomonas sp. SUN019 TaxID=2937788 RepID=UPI002164AC41|nr:NAD-dependent epimerase/dehydratase family protein [Sphingomonas sp. SUN019]UVO50007.1 NAD-dependent epimerase/dehydratase family protein [Sphingomonas sp. SUN019]
MTRLALVTGATGGLGRTLVPTLVAAGWQVRATGRRTGDGIIPLDLTQPIPATLADGVDVVFHLAALSSPWGRPRDFAAINMDATARLLEAAARAGCRRLVHVSTPSIYAEARERLDLTERSPPAARFASAYASTKWQGERLVLAADSPAMRTIVLRPRAIVGPHDAVLLPRLMRAIRQGRVPLPGGGAALVELTDARDIATALIAAADAEVGGAAFNISGGQPRSVRWIVTRITARLGLTPRIANLPRPLAMAGAGALEAIGRITSREPLITRYGVMTLGWSQTFDLSAARDRLGWTPRISPEDAIDHALEAICAA